MKFISTILFLAIFIFQFPQDAEAQILRRTLGKLGERVVEKKVEKEIDKKIDEVADSIVYAIDGEEPLTDEERQKNQENRRRAGELMKGMMGGINQVDLPDNYQFEYSIAMEMEDHKGNITHMTYYMEDKSSVMGYELNDEDMKKNQNQFVVMDFEQEYMATFSESDGEKVAMSMPLPMDMITSMASAEMEKQDEEEYSFEKTGNTRTINGYHCSEYLVTTEDHIQHLWLTKDVNVTSTFTKVFANMMKSNQEFQNPLGGEGYPILMELIEKKRKNRTTYMRTKEIKKGSFPFQASEYSYAY